jgi:hypothetical protein
MSLQQNRNKLVPANFQMLADSQPGMAQIMHDTTHQPTNFIEQIPS